MIAILLQLYNFEVQTSKISIRDALIRGIHRTKFHSCTVYTVIIDRPIFPERSFFQGQPPVLGRYYNEETFPKMKKIFLYTDLCARKGINLMQKDGFATIFIAAEREVTHIARLALFFFL